MYKAIDKWLPGYIRGRLTAERVPAQARHHLLFCLVDHFEPLGIQNCNDLDTGARIVRRWVDTYPRLVEPFCDSDGGRPKHSIFFPADQYEPSLVDPLAELVRANLCEVDIHLHHRDDTPESLAQKLIDFRDQLHERHGLLGHDRQGNPRYGFIHGNWAVCNSRPDGDWCGVNNELRVLRETGCYADFTMPSAPSPTQARTVNRIYYASDTPGRPRGHDRGVSATALPEVAGASRSESASSRSETLQLHPEPDTRYPTPETDGVHPERDAPATSADTGHRTPNTPHPERDAPATGGAARLLLIPGPLGLNWQHRKLGLLPRIENADVSANNGPSASRFRVWLKTNVHVRGLPNWTVVKLHTHGCLPRNMDALLAEEGQVRQLYRLLTDECRKRDILLHFVSARELYNFVKAAEAGTLTNNWRQFEIM